MRIRLHVSLAAAIFGCFATVLFAEPAKLYWTEEGFVGIKRSNLDGSQVENVLATGENVAYLTASFSLEKLFYAVGSPTPQLWSADLNGQNRQLLATFDDANYVRGMAFDPATQRLYWTSSHGYAAGNGKVHSANVDGSDVQQVLALSDNYPYGMAVDADSGRMFWANTLAASLERASLDGTAREVIDSGATSATSQLAIDSVAQRLYWNDPENNRIRWSNYDGSQAADIVALSSAFTAYDSGIAVHHPSGSLFWSDTSTDRIYRARLDGSDPMIIIGSGLSNPGSMIVVGVPEPRSGLLMLAGLLLAVAAGWVRRSAVTHHAAAPR
jgi:hypothetical protein